jgi:electron transfer flavoprotein alpha subunit
MSVLIVADHADGLIKKAGCEAICYGVAVAKQLGVGAELIVLGNAAEDFSSMGKYGVTKIHYLKNAAFEHFDAQLFSKTIAGSAIAMGATVIVFSFGVSGKAIAPGLSALLKAGLVTGAVSLPDLSNGFTVKKSVFSGKAFANIAINSAIKIIAISPNSYKIEETGGTATVSETDINTEPPKIKVTATNKLTGEIPLSEAELVVSGGRGLKGPENWYLVTDLAKEIGAATACSRAVADAHWRPHHEHVGQTGGSIAPNLYFAIAISGAIQHLAGVNRSKVIVVINKDPEAPFFKAADYGIVGDAFELMPKIVEAVKKMKAS